MMLGIYLFLTVFLVPLKAQSYDVLCQDSYNPLNIRFNVPMEKLVEGSSVFIDPVAINLLDPRDIACSANTDYVTIREFKRAVTCNLRGIPLVVCTVNEKCTTQRKEALLRIRKSLLKVLDEIVLKVQGIKFFNEFIEVKHLFFGTDRLSKLTGLQILIRVTNSKLDVVNGFSVSSPFHSFKREHFEEYFGKAVDLYARLKAAETPTGQLSERICRMSWIPPNELHYCYEQFQYRFRGNRRLDLPDQKLIALLEEALKYIVNYLSEGKKQFDELELPLNGHCIGSDGMEPTSSFMRLLKTVETAKNL